MTTNVPSSKRPLVTLTGSGVSVGAGIPHAKGVLDGIEDKFASGGDWENHMEDYSEIKKAITHHLSAVGSPGGLDSLGPEERAEFLYGFEHLVDWLWDGKRIGPVSGEIVRKLYFLVMNEFGNMLKIRNPECAAYFNVLPELQSRLGRRIHVWSLNFDLGFETLHRPGFRVATGFAGYGKGHYWNKDRFRLRGSRRGLDLHKMHGSVNWRETSEGRLYSLDPKEPIDITKARIVLGRGPKKRRDFPEPYEFYKSRFRDLSSMAREVYVVGYGFGDREINDMLREFVNGEFCDRLVVVTKFGKDMNRKRETRHIRELLGGSDKIRVVSMDAKRLLETIERWLPFLK